jgi:hypothetical protein
MSVKKYSVKKDGNKQLSNNFTVGEFLCRCGCGRALVDDTLVGFLQRIRDHFNQPVIITSPYRCEKHNKAVGGESGSRHTKGQAADFYIPHVEPAEIAKYAESIGVNGIGLYEAGDCGDNFVHIDTRENKSFWYGHAQKPRTTFGGAPKQKFTVELSILSRGCEGEEVRALQVMLKGYGYQIVADGIYGAKTENAVMCYQEDNGLFVDGIAGFETRKNMNGI